MVVIHSQSLATACLSRVGRRCLVWSLGDKKSVHKDSFPFCDGGWKGTIMTRNLEEELFLGDLTSASRSRQPITLCQAPLTNTNQLSLIHTIWFFPDLPCAASQLPVSSALLPALPLVSLPEEVTPAVTVTRLPAATCHGKRSTMSLPTQLDAH